MKKCLLIILAALGACQEENETVYSVDPSLSPYVDTFYAEALERGVTIPRNLVAELREEIQGITKSETVLNQNYLYFSPVIFNQLKSEGDEVMIEAYVAFQLAGLFLGVEQPCISDNFNNPPRPCAYEIVAYDRESAFDSFVDNP